MEELTKRYVVYRIIDTGSTVSRTMGYYVDQDNVHQFARIDTVFDFKHEAEQHIYELLHAGILGPFIVVEEYA